MTNLVNSARKYIQIFDMRFVQIYKIFEIDQIGH